MEGVMRGRISLVALEAADLEDSMEVVPGTLLAVARRVVVPGTPLTNHPVAVTSGVKVARQSRTELRRCLFRRRRSEH